MRRSVLFALFLISAYGLAADASTLCSLPLANLAAQAERIVLVQIEKLEIETREGQPFTRALARVSRTYKGPPAATIPIRMPGGEINGFVMVVPGSPTLRVGEQFVAFLERDETAGFAQPAYRPLGLGQGLFAVVKKQNRTYAIQSLAGAPQEFTACEEPAAACLARLGVMGAELPELIRQIRAALTASSP